ncbi:MULTISPECIES: GNAT family N-acetyltransferase [Marinomonas]|uniref:GNAT family N-acetyltransferase n=1 Tax=Marinomonas rhodophyticola TaxID=2992803 RepID=A0ABT3KL25_9GAMM|nr:GNAT family N-acetyltransferase [Marinomonas sp. KJ51-3]MCW4631266.1 GNAT family N-acetyltransferase [Marinomonas sp. KJ51-3]|tara:strand:- start:49771 stop:50214 length:444 start_codon:yes stop_codon:yes gene_type:complete
MDIQKVDMADLELVKHFIGQVSAVDVLPNFNDQGKAEYKARVLPDIITTFDAARFQTLKVVFAGEIVGFGALRDGNYLTHLFVSKSVQGQGIGKRLLSALLNTTEAKEISLRSSVNAVGFYESYGFEATGSEADFNGIRFVPMSLAR